nr:Arm DNA-binding domain-containing protein [uncultured Anaerobutyricum sp.]
MPFFRKDDFHGKVGTRKRGKTWQYYFQLVSVDGTRKWKTGSGYRTKAEAQAAVKQRTVLLSVKNGTFTVYDILMQRFFMRQVFQCH